MTLMRQLLSVCVLMSLPLMASAKDNQCYLDQQRQSDFCQKVMFPPIPFR
jgi:hypothetical protein